MNVFDLREERQRRARQRKKSEPQDQRTGGVGQEPRGGVAATGTLLRFPSLAERLYLNFARHLWSGGTDLRLKRDDR